MSKRKIKTNVDKRRLSFVQPHDFFDYLLTIVDDGGIRDFDGWSLMLLRKDRAADEAEIVDEEDAEREACIAAYEAVNEAADEALSEISANLVLANREVLGRFQFNNTNKYKGLAFFTFTNKALYDYGCGCGAMLYTATSQLGLELCGLTQTDIALDVNCNIYPHLMRLFRDSEHYDMILNGNRVDDSRRTLRGVGEWFSRSRERRERFPTLYIQQKRDDGLKVRIYDKKKEIEESDKTYITEHNGFGAAQTYRIEIEVKWTQFKNWLRHIDRHDTIVPDEWKRQQRESVSDHVKRTNYLYIGDDDYCLALWSWAADHVIYFREKATNRKVSLLDIAKGTV